MAKVKSDNFRMEKTRKMSQWNDRRGLLVARRKRNSRETSRAGSCSNLKRGGAVRKGSLSPITKA